MRAGLIQCRTVLAALVVDRDCALQWRRRADLVGNVAAALLAGLGEVLCFIGAIDLLVRVGHDRDFERDGIGERAGQLRIEGYADDQDAVHERSEEQHGWQAVRHDRRHEPQLVERIYCHVRLGHMRAKSPPFCLHKQAPASHSE